MLIDELRDVLARDEFRRWLTRQDAQRFVDRLDTEADRRPDPTEIPAVTDDPKDDYLVALYRDNSADLLVSGDSDLLISPPRTSPSSRPPNSSTNYDRNYPYRSARRSPDPIGIGGYSLVTTADVRVSWIVTTTTRSSASR